MKLSPLLLTDPSPCLRWLVLRRLFGYAADHPEVQELERLRQSDPLLLELLTCRRWTGRVGAAPSRRAAGGRQPGGRHRLYAEPPGLPGLRPVSPRRAARRGVPLSAPASRRIVAAAAGSRPVGDDEATRSAMKTKHLPPHGHLDDAAADRLALPRPGSLRLRRRPAQRTRLRVAARPAPARWRLAHRHRLGRLRLRGWLPPAGALALGLPLQHHRRPDLPGAPSAAPPQRRRRGVPWTCCWGERRATKPRWASRPPGWWAPSARAAT